MRELLLLDLAGFRCGVWKEDVLSHEEQSIHWLTDNNSAVTAIAMMGAQPVSLADLSYCLGLAPVRRARRYPVLVPAGHDLSVSFVVEQEKGKVQLPSTAVFSLPVYLQTLFIDSCVELGGKLVPLINIREVHRQVSVAGYTPRAPKFHLPLLKGKSTPSLASFRVFTCKEKSFAASVDYFVSEQAQSPGVLTTLPLLPAFVQGMTLYCEQVLTVLDIREYLQLPSEQEGGEEKWLIGTVEGQGFVFVVDSDQGILSADSVTLAPLPMLVRSDWRQNAILSDRKIISVLDFRALLAQPPDKIHSQVITPSLKSERHFASVFGKQPVDIVEFTLYKMIHALPDVEVVDTLPFTHCQRLAGSKGLVAGVTLYQNELLPVLDLARCFGRESHPTPNWKLLQVCNGDLRVLVLVEEVFGKRTLTVSEQRALPFTAPHSSVYGCYPVASRVGLILNVLALTTCFDDKQVRKLFFFSDDLLPLVNENEKGVNPKSELRTPAEESFAPDDSFVREPRHGEEGAEEGALIPSENKGIVPPERHAHSRGQAPVADWDLERNASVLLAEEEQDTLVQSVVASMLSGKTNKSESESDKNDGSSGFVEEPEELAGIGEESGETFSSVVAALLSHKEDELTNGLRTVGQGGQDKAASDVLDAVEPKEDVVKEKEGTVETAFHEEDSVPSHEGGEGTTREAAAALEAAPVLLTEEQDHLQDHLMTSTLVSILRKGKGKGKGEGKNDRSEVDEKQGGGSGALSEAAGTLLQGDRGQSVVSRGKEDRFLASAAEHDGFSNEFSDIEDASRAGQSDSGSDRKTLLSSSLEENEQLAAAESGQGDDLFDPEEADQGTSRPLTALEESQQDGPEKEGEGPVFLTEEQEKLLQFSLLTAFHHEKEQKDIHRSDTPKEGEGREKEYASSLDEGQSLVPSGNSLVVSQNSLQDDERPGAGTVHVQENDDAFFLQEKGEDLEKTDDNGVPSDFSAIMFTEEQDALLQSSLATAFSRKDEKGHADKSEEQEESAGGDKLIEAPAGEGQASFTSAHAVPEKNDSFSSSPTAANDFKKQTDSSEGADSQREEGVRTAVSPDVEAVGGREEENFSLEPPAQLQDWEDTALLSEDWSLPEEAGTFSELKEFVRQFSGTEQETLSPTLAPADFVKQVQFPPLLSPDPRKIKKKLDKIKKREWDILFQDAAYEVEKEPLPPPQAQESRRFRLWMLFLLLALFAGFFLWLFIYRNQEVFRGKNIKSESSYVEINKQAVPEVLDGAFEKREGDGRIEKDIPEKVPEQLVAHPSASPESESVLADQEGVGQEGQGTLSGHPGQAIFEQSTAAIPVEDFFEKRGLSPKTVAGKDVLKNAVKQEEGTEGQELGETVEGLARDAREENDKEKAVSQEHAVDDLPSKTGVRRDKEPVEDSGVTPPAAITDKEDLGRGKPRKSGAAVLRRGREGRLSNEPEAAPRAKSDEKRGEQRQAVPVVDLSQDISSDIARKGQGNVVKEVAKTGGLAQPMEQGGDLEDGRATKQGISAVAGSGDGVPAVEAGKAPGEASSFTESVHVEQKKRPLMSPLYGTSDQTYHTVSKGDTLWKISEQYTGSGFNYPDVAKKNEIANPDLIYPHQQVKLPAKK